MTNSVQGINLVELRHNMADSFSMSDLDALCFDLGIESGDVPGPELQTRVIQIIRYCQRRGPLLFELIAYCEQARPHIDWRQSIESQASSPNSVEQRIRHRNDLYESTDGIQMVHTMMPSRTRENYWDILIYLIRHESKDLSIIDYAEFFFGRYWGDKIFKVPNLENFVGVLISAYGPTLCTCRAVLTNGHEVMLSRYIDFEMTNLISKTTQDVDLARLSNLIGEMFSADEVESLAFELGIDSEELAGGEKKEKVDRIVRYMDLEHQLPRLLALVRQQRPQADWEG